MLERIECGCCSGELGQGWVAYRCDDPDPDEGDKEPAIALYCPPGAAAEFGYRPDIAETYVRVWESISSEVPRRLSPSTAPRLAMLVFGQKVRLEAPSFESGLAAEGVRGEQDFRARDARSL